MIRRTCQALTSPSQAKINAEQRTVSLNAKQKLKKKPKLPANVDPESLTSQGEISFGS